MGDYVWDPYPMQNFITIRLTSFAPQICENAYLVTPLAFLVFTVLHAMQTRSSDENSVCPSVSLSVHPSVRLSNACFVTKWKKDRSRFLYHTKDHLAWFSEKKNG